MLKILTGEIKLLALDLERDYSGIDALLEAEEWPFSRCDFEVSHGQPNSTSYVARRGDRVVGFFTTHNFGDVGYLDMMIVEPEYRKHGVAKALYLKTMLELKRKGIKKYVVHTTNDSAPMIRFLRFQSSCDFTLLARDPVGEQAPENEDVRPLQADEIEQIIELDGLSFGMERPHWLRSLMAQDEVEFWGLRSAQGLDAVLCLRPRKGGALCLDCVTGRSSASIEALVDEVLKRNAERRVECFVKSESSLHQLLVSRGFEVPEFFRDIGPLVEWQKGGVNGLGSGAVCLTWL